MKEIIGITSLILAVFFWIPTLLAADPTWEYIYEGDILPDDTLLGDNAWQLMGDNKFAEITDQGELHIDDVGENHCFFLYNVADAALMQQATIEARVKVLSQSGSANFEVLVGMQDGSNSKWLDLFPDHILLNNTNSTYDVDMTEYHILRMVRDTADIHIYVDDEEVISEPHVGAGESWIGFIFGAGCTACTSEQYWDYLVFTTEGGFSPEELPSYASMRKTELAAGPNPADGALHSDTWINISWRPGNFAVSHDVYIGDNFDDVNSGAEGTFQGNQASTNLILGFPGFPYPEGLVPGTIYYWRIDEVNDADPNSPWKGDVWSFWIPPYTAYEPDPTDGVKYVPSDVELSWTAGFNAKLHTVYFGDNFDDVNNATVGIPSALNTYNPGTLELEKFYYWRIDEFDGIATHKGDVWSFRTLPEIPITDPNLIGWWTLDEGMGTTAVDWSGYGNHGTLVGAPEWVAGASGLALEFDGDDHVDCGNDPSLDITAPITIMIWARPSVVGETHTTNPGVIAKAESGVGWRWQLRYKAVDTPGYMGFQFNSVSGGSVWAHVGQNLEVGEWYHIAGVADGTSAICYLNGQETDRQPLVDFQSSNGKLFIGYEGWIPWYGTADDARIYDKALTVEEIQLAMRGDPSLAWGPNPSQGSAVYIRDATPLSWSSGDNASQHDVYFGTDRGAVADADASDTTGIYRGRQGVTIYTPPEVEWGGGTYYWRVDEYNTDATISKGNVWSFTVTDFIVIDDIEDYNDYPPDEIFSTWIDGWEVPTNGSMAGHADPPFAETGNVHGGRQSMPLYYENNLKYSEITMTLVYPRNWTKEGVGVLSLWFYGDAANAAERMYVNLNGIATVYHDNPDAALIDTWTEWIIDLQEFAVQGVNLANVNKISIGFADKNNLQAGGTGMVLFDDIRLYRSAPELEPAP